MFQPDDSWLAEGSKEEEEEELPGKQGNHFDFVSTTATTGMVFPNTTWKTPRTAVLFIVHLLLLPSWSWIALGFLIRCDSEGEEREKAFSQRHGPAVAP